VQLIVNCWSIVTLTLTGNITGVSRISDGVIVHCAGAVAVMSSSIATGPNGPLLWNCERIVTVWLAATTIGGPTIAMPTFFTSATAHAVMSMFCLCTLSSASCSATGKSGTTPASKRMALSWNDFCAQETVYERETSRVSPESMFGSVTVIWLNSTPPMFSSMKLSPDTGIQCAEQTPISVFRRIVTSKSAT
jgi:hypothetical protein